MTRRQPTPTRSAETMSSLGQWRKPDVKDFNSLSGPWAGFSVQDGRRIGEKMTLSIFRCKITGVGTDKDGRFELSGFYEPNNRRVELVRHYNWTTAPGQAGVGILYEYRGEWDGDLAYGEWFPRFDPSYGGQFEMWPEQDTDSVSASLEMFETKVLALS